MPSPVTTTTRALEPAPEPMHALAALAAADPAGAFLLESRLSARDTPLGGRWSFAGAWPTAVVEGSAADDADPLARVEEALRPLAAARRGALEAPDGGAAEAPPFVGGAVGFIGYDYGRRLERLPSGARADHRFADVRFGIYPHVLAFDHVTGGAVLVGAREGFPEAWERLQEALARHAARGPGHALGGPEWASDRVPGARAPLARTFDRAGYEGAVRRAIEYIRAGDIFEVNLAQRFEARFPGSAAALYARLRERAPAPMAALLPGGPGRAVISASPERYISLRGRRLCAEPIKGTRPRGASPDEDRRLAAELEASAKDRAELAMIVDLLRNDLGRVARAGSVRVARACELRSFPTVHHLVGTVEADLAEGLTAFDAIRASFPGGSITGAPKVRAMEVIDELEPVRRSVYTGAFGWIAPSGDADLAIAIRTVLLDDARASFHAGGAVTALSDPAAEYDETLAKARAIADALGASLDEADAPALEAAHAS